MQVLLNDASAPQGFRLADAPLPPVRSGDVRIKVAAVSFNPVDFQAPLGPAKDSQTRSQALGLDLSGTVDAVGGDVGELRPGDEVYSYICRLGSGGSCAEYVTVPAELVARKPSKLSHEEAAAVPVAGLTATLALEKARLDSRRSIFIAGGAGGVGTFFIMLAQRLAPSGLITTAGKPESRAYLINRCELRDDQIIDYKQPDFIAAALARNGGPYDAVLDLVGGEMLANCCRLVALDGDLISATNPPTTEDFEVLFQRNASFHAIGANAYSLVDDRRVWGKYRELLTAFAALFDLGGFPAPPIQTIGPFSVATVQRARDLLNASAAQGKLVMSCP